MGIRSDFNSVENMLSRLVEYASVFKQCDSDWGHYKNNEDFREIYSLDIQSRRPLEKIYSEGRELACGMSSLLISFNDTRQFPTLRSFVDYFDSSWFFNISAFKNQLQQAKDTCKNIDHVPWAVEKMLLLFEEQINLLQPVKQAISVLKETELYKWENGEPQVTYPVAEYNKILELIHGIGKMFERLPSTYSNKDEEQLRDHILVSLEAMVTGSATGESFNKKGKTDILVRNNNSNEFIGECKFWHGKVAFLETIDQLLSYLSWRDTNAAAIIFVQSVDFTSILNKVHKYTPEHPNYLRAVNSRDETWFNYEFRMNEDSSRVINMAVMLYHMPKIS